MNDPTTRPANPVLDEDCIVQIGTNEFLLREGVYKRLYGLQFNL